MQYVTKYQEFGNFINELEESEFLGFDLETTGLDCFVDKILLCQIKTKNEIFVFDWQKLGKKYTDYLIQLIQEKTLIGHNLTFDIKFIKSNTQIWLTHLFDTMIVENIITNGISTNRYPSLADLTFKYLNIVLDKTVREKFIGATEITQEMLIYASEDVMYLENIKDKQEEIIKQQKHERVVYEIEMPVIAPTASLEYNGVLLDREDWTKQIEIAEEEVIRLEKEVRDSIFDRVDFSNCKTIKDVYELLAIPYKKTKINLALVNEPFIKEYHLENIKNEFNTNSSYQIKASLNLLGFNIESTGEDVLNELDSDDLVIANLLEYRMNQKLISTYGESFIKLIHPVTGRVHPTFNQSVPQSGRYSSDSPNMQNIPAKDGYRNSFKAKPGYKIVGVDLCLPLGTKVLKSDLNWINIEDLNIGDGLVSIEEESTSKHTQRKMVEGFVERLGRNKLHCYEIVLESGRTLISTDEHPWLTIKNSNNTFDWIETSKLKVGNKLSFFVDPWEKGEDYATGYLAGIFDGEASINNSKRGGMISFYQLEGDIMNKTMNYLKDYFYNYKGPYKRKTGFSERSTLAIYLCGVNQMMRFLGEIHPDRLYKKQKEMWIGRTPFKSGKPDKIVAINDVGILEVITMQTSTHTFLADGYWTHNSQQEYRLVGAISGEQVIIDAYKAGLDMHTSTASLVYGVPINEVSKKQRNEAKTINFSIIYGTSGYGLAKKQKFYYINRKGQKKIDGKRGDELINTFFSGYPVLYYFMNMLKAKVLELGYSCTMTGRKRYFSPIKPLYQDHKKREQEIEAMGREAFNHPIQGTAADSIKISLIRLFYENPFGEDNYRLYNTVHDEIVAEVREDLAEQAKEWQEKIMMESLQPFLGEIPAKCEGYIADYWRKG